MRRNDEIGEEGGGSAEDALTSVTNIHRQAQLHFGMNNQSCHRTMTEQGRRG